MDITIAAVIRSAFRGWSWCEAPSSSRMLWNVAAQLTGAILVVVGAILPMVDPPGDAPRFLRMTAGCDDATRSELARRIAV